MSKFPTTDWREAARIVRARRDASLAAIDPPLPQVPEELPLDVREIPAQLLTKHEVEITETLPEELVARLAVGVWKSEEVVRAFLRRAGVAQKLVNCVTELLPERAISRAKELDEYLLSNGKPVGPLHGLPISVKEHIGMKGLEVNASYCSLVGNIMKEDAMVLQILWNAGAVFYVRTTEPQTIMHLETATNLYGVTVNPANRNLTPGGSSGGEGSLIALRGSCLGIGTDIGGSIRSPAANNGIYGFRPTANRLSEEGIIEPIDGMVEQILGVCGPMSTSIEGVKLFMKTILDGKPWLQSPATIPIPWRVGENFLNDKRKLKVAVMWDDEVVKPHPPILRALKEVVSALKDGKNVEVVDWKPLRHDEGWEIIASLYFVNGAKGELETLDASGEPLLPLTKFIITENPHVKRLDPEGIYYWTGRREEYRSEYARAWNKTATSVGENGEPLGMVDVILCPVGPGAAPPLECSRYWPYTSQWNLTDYPSLSFPVTSVEPSLDQKDKDYKPVNDDDQYNYDLYSPERYKNAPVSLQLVGRRFEDEKVIQAFEIIDKHLKEFNLR